jgi:very-short-patch-repair endonuclease
VTDYRSKLPERRPLAAALEEMHPVDIAIAKFASRQKGAITTEQLLALGLSRTAVAYRVRIGRLHRIHRGVYLVGHDVPPPLAYEQAALLACGESSFLSYRTAGRLFDVLEGEGPIEVTVLGDRRVPELHIHTSVRLERRDTTRRDGLRVTTIARTLLDCAEVLDAGELERAVESAFAQGRVSERQLRAILARSPGRHGRAQLAALLDYRGDDGYTLSLAEDLMRRLQRAARLPRFKANAKVGPYRVDFLFPNERVIVEVDSWAHHSSRKSFESDRRRWDDLQAMGYRVVAITWTMLRHEPQATVARIAAALALASQR